MHKGSGTERVYFLIDFNAEDIEMGNALDDV